MNRKQKIFLTISTLIIIITLFAITYTITTPPQPSNKLQVVTTFYPLTYLTQQIGGDYIEITQLIPDNTDIHSWEPAISHIMAAEDANIIFYNGADADHWMEENILPALSTANNRIVVETTTNLILTPNTEHNHENDHDHDHDHGTYDPHTWISPDLVKQQAENIYTTLVTVDPQHEKYYTQNWQNLKHQLEQLDDAYLNGLSNTKRNHIFVSHEAYGYLASRYGFTQQGVIGLSADQQPSITTIRNIIDEMKKQQTYTLYFDPLYSDKHIQTIKNEIQIQTEQTVTVLKLYLMLGPLDNLDYLEQIQTNLTNLQTGLEITS
jgi:zinc transport system substrate-binding protein